MRVLHLIDSLGLGGAQTVVKGVFDAQKKNKNIFLFALRKREINTRIDHPNVKTFNSKAKYSFKPLKELKRLIKKERIEILHCHLFRSQLFGWILKKSFPNLKLIMHEHGQIFRNDFYYNVFMKITQKQTNLFIVVSRATKQKLIEKAKINPKKIKVLHNFVDLSKFNKKNIKWNIKKEREKLGIKSKEFVIGFAGRLVERKGWEEFVETAKQDPMKNIKFIIAGDGKDKKVLLSKIKDQNNIKYLGYISDMNNFYNCLNCFIIPSHWEPLGLTQLEAQSCGCPVIASDIEGLNEVVNNKKDCLFFEAKDSIDLGKKITIIYQNRKLREKLIKEGLKNVKKYSLKNYIKKLNEVYNEK